jgi:Flp pilus assembly protein TadG
MLKSILAKNERGSTMVEAAIVFPIVILSVIATLALIVNFYVASVENVSMHMATNARADSESGTGKLTLRRSAALDRYSEEILSGKITSRTLPSSLFGHKIANASKTRRYVLTRFVRGSFGEEKESKTYIIDEEKVKRNDILP